ncbi:MAG: packaged DNA stabilization gp4 family protein [Pseudomonadales bacterium]|jgi:hypothetical protein
MGWTKRQFIDAAFDEIGMATYTFDLSASQLQSALRRLDTMMAEWNAKGLRLNYPLPNNPGATNIDEDTFVPDSANEAIITNLAIRLAPGFGKQPMPDTKSTARMGYNTLLSRAAKPIEQQLPDTMPSGAGNKPWWYDNPFMQRPVDPVTVGGDGVLEYN